MELQVERLKASLYPTHTVDEVHLPSRTYSTRVVRLCTVILSHCPLGRLGRTTLERHHTVSGARHCPPLPPKPSHPPHSFSFFSLTLNPYLNEVTVNLKAIPLPSLLSHSEVLRSSFVFLPSCSHLSLIPGDISIPLKLGPFFILVSPGVHTVGIRSQLPVSINIRKVACLHTHPGGFPHWVSFG